MIQEELFIEDDHPERDQTYIYNPSAIATIEDIKAFFAEVAEILNPTSAKR